MNENMTKILKYFSNINKEYKIFVKCLSSDNIYTADSTEYDNETISKIDPLASITGGKINRYSYIDFNNPLLSNYHTIISRMVDECVSISDKICSEFGIENKIKKLCIDVHDMLRNKAYKAVMILLVKNFKYLKRQIDTKYN
jgi:hypothetical protein